MPGHSQYAGIPKTIKTWGQGLRFARQRAQLAQKDVASSVGVSAIDVDLWESGNGAPSHRVLSLLYGKLPLLSRFTHMLPRLMVKAASEEETERRKKSAALAAPPPAPPPASAPWNPTLAEALKEVRTADVEVAKPAPEPPPPPPPSPTPAAAPPPPAPVSDAAPVSFGKALVEARARRGWDQKKSSEKAGVNQSNLSRWERGGNIARVQYDRLIRAYPELADIPAPLESRKGSGARAQATRRERNGAGAPEVTTAPPVATPAPPAAPEPPPAVAAAAPLSGFDPQGLDLARAIAEMREANLAYDKAFAEAQAADERRKAAVARAEKLLTELREAAGWR